MLIAVARINVNQLLIRLHPPACILFLLITPLNTNIELNKQIFRRENQDIHLPRINKHISISRLIQNCNRFGD